MIKIPDSVNAIIEDAFAEPITRLSIETTQSAEGYISSTFEEADEIMGNVIPVNTSNAERYGFDIDSDIVFSTIDTISESEAVRYNSIDYRITKVNIYTNYSLVEGKLWQE